MAPPPHAGPSPVHPAGPAPTRRPTSAPVGVHGVLSVLADVADAASPARAATGSPLPSEFDWLPLGDLQWSRVPTPRGVPGPGSSLPARRLDRLRAVDAIRPGERSLRLGWLFVAGTVPTGSAAAGSPGRGGAEPAPSRRVFEPLVTVEVVAGRKALEVVGEPQLTPLITDRHEQLRLEPGIEWGGGGLDGMGPEVSEALLARLPRLLTFARQAAAAARLPATELVPAGGSPSGLSAQPGLRIVAGLAVYAMAHQLDFSPAGSLREWHARVGTGWTALHALYLPAAPPPPPPAGSPPSPLPLTAAQEACVAEARTAPLTVVSGAPGTGKTHTIAAVVADAVAHGRSVLVAARSEPAVEAITELLAQRPGPEPVVFGSGALRSDLARRLAAGEPVPCPAAEVDARLAELRRALADRDELRRLVLEAVEGLDLLAGPAGTALRRRLPGLVRPDVDTFTVQALLHRVGTAPPPWWQLGSRKRWRQLLDLLAVDAPPDPDDLRRAACLATALAGLHGAADPLGAGLPWRDLAAAQAAVEAAAGRWLDAASRDERRLTSQVRAARGALATALRSGRARRRAQLAELGPAVARALPVWVGTLGDVDDLLPMVPGLFDLVVVDEASSVDQPRAAPALLRGAQAVVVGDPHQLRHVSFVADEAVGAALARHLPDAPPSLAARLDVRRSSLFDVAAGAAPIRRLDEHFRSEAHLFGFVARRLYDDAVAIATLSPATDDLDLISVTRLEGAARDSRKVVRAEVDHVLDRLAELRAAGARSVGVLSPFRAQADAIEAAALDALGADGVEALGLRVGTVHAFQGMQRDHVLVSLGIGAGDGAATWRFADDPNLFAVLATRARQRIEWLVSADPPPGSLIGEYLAQEASPPPPQRGVAPEASPGAREMAAHLAAAGDGEVVVAAPYRAGRHTLDLVLIRPDRAHLGVELALHPHGPAAHVRRHVELAGAGWPLLTAFWSQWGDRPGELAVRLRRALEELPRP